MMSREGRRNYLQKIRGNDEVAIKKALLLRPSREIVNGKLPKKMMIGTVAIAVVACLTFSAFTGLSLSSYQPVEEIRAAETSVVALTKQKNKPPARNPAVKWQARYALDENKDSYLQERIDFADELLKKHSITDLTYEYLLPKRNTTDNIGKNVDDSTSDTKNKDTEKWFIFSVASDVSGAKLSTNQCASLLSHNVTKCVMIGYKHEALQWWKNNAQVLPANAFVYDATQTYEWAYAWNHKENSRTALENYLMVIDFDKYHSIQALVLARTLLFIDLLHHGINVWMLDSDAVFPLDPKGMFMDPDYDCVYMMNVGDFTQKQRYEVPYSYPFIVGGKAKTDRKEQHVTMNNGIVASRATEASLKLWQWSFDRVLNHASGDPQHPHNQLLFLLGLTLTKVPVAGYPDLGGTFGYYEGSAKLHVHQNDTLPLHVRGVATASGYDKFTREVLLQHVAIHAVGVGGMSYGQGIKCEYFKRIGFWEIGASCSNDN